MNRITPTRMAVLCAVVLAVLLSAAPAFAAPPNPIVSGTLRGSDGVAIADGQVVISHQVRGVWRTVVTLPTTDGGAWTFNGKPDYYRFDFSAPFADPQTRYLTTVRGNAYTLDVALQAYGGVSGSITEASGGVGLDGAAVELYRRNADGTWPSTPFATTTAGGSGAYSVTNLPCGDYAVKACASGCVDGFYGGGTTPETAGQIGLTRGVTSSASVALAPLPTGPSTIGGHVSQGLYQTPYANCSVFIFKQKADGTWPTSFAPGNEYDWVFTDILGNWVNEKPLTLGNYKVRFFPPHGSQEWYDHVPTISEATTLSITYEGQSYSGIDAWLYRQ
jgi:hypothetical protein